MVFTTSIARSPIFSFHRREDQVTRQNNSLKDRFTVDVSPITTRGRHEIQPLSLMFRIFVINLYITCPFFHANYFSVV